MKKICLLSMLLLLSLTGNTPLSQEASQNPTEPKVCQVHGETLKPQKVRIEYGHFYFDSPEWFEANEQLFPNASQFVTEACKSRKDIREDGSCVRRGGARYKAIFYCQQCREAEKSWLKARRLKKPYYRKGIMF